MYFGDLYSIQGVCIRSIIFTPSSSAKAAVVKLKIAMHKPITVSIKSIGTYLATPTYLQIITIILNINPIIEEASSAFDFGES